MKAWVGTFAALAALSLTPPASAQSTDLTEWKVCNQTSFALRVATATVANADLTVSGWTTVYAGDCADYQVKPDAPRYVLAESNPAHIGGIREWKGTVELCASDADFTARTDQDCSLQNLETRRFLQVDADEAQTLLVEPDDYGKKAETAGLQRLLRDTGYKIRRIDGLTGRGTTRQKTQFLKDEELNSKLSGAKLFEALIDVAAKRRAEIGLTVCNESNETVWSAVGFRRDGTWRSRGWWEAEAGACVQVLTETLDGLDAHLFALQEDTTQPERDPDDPDPDPDAPLPENPDRRLRAVATSPSQFCISEARFAALGREDCRDRGYVSANFRPLPTDVEGERVTLTDADFVKDAPGGLRR